MWSERRVRDAFVLDKRGPNIRCLLWVADPTWPNSLSSWGCRGTAWRWPAWTSWGSWRASTASRWRASWRASTASTSRRRPSPARNAMLGSSMRTVVYFMLSAFLRLSLGKKLVWQVACTEETIQGHPCSSTVDNWNFVPCYQQSLFHDHTCQLRQIFQWREFQTRNKKRTLRPIFQWRTFETRAK